MINKAKLNIQTPMFENNKPRFVNDDRNTITKPSCSSGILTPDSSTSLSASATVVKTEPPRFTPKNVTELNASVFVKSYNTP